MFFLRSGNTRQRTWLSSHSKKDILLILMRNMKPAIRETTEEFENVGVHDGMRLLRSTENDDGLQVQDHHDKKRKGGIEADQRIPTPGSRHVYRGSGQQMPLEPRPCSPLSGPADGEDHLWAQRREGDVYDP